MTFVICSLVLNLFNPPFAIPNVSKLLFNQIMKVVWCFGCHQPQNFPTNSQPELRHLSAHSNTAACQ